MIKGKRLASLLMKNYWRFYIMRLGEKNLLLFGIEHLTVLLGWYRPIEEKISPLPPVNRRTCAHKQRDIYMKSQFPKVTKWWAQEHQKFSCKRSTYFGRQPHMQRCTAKLCVLVGTAMVVAAAGGIGYCNKQWRKNSHDNNSTARITTLAKATKDCSKWQRKKKHFSRAQAKN